MSRRALLSAGAAGFCGASLPALFSAEGVGRGDARAKHVIFLHQFGGPSHIDTFDLKPQAPDGIRGEFQPIATSVPGIHICEHLPRLAQVAHLFAQVRSVHHTVTNHNPASYYSLSGQEPPNNNLVFRESPDLFPGYGAVVSKFHPSDAAAIPSWVSFPYSIQDGVTTPAQTAGFLGKSFDPLYVGQNPNDSRFRVPTLTLPESISAQRLSDRMSLLASVDAESRRLQRLSEGLEGYRARAISLLTSPEVRRAFDLSAETDHQRDAYGRTAYGQSCLLARRLVESGVRFVTVYFSKHIGGKGDDGGWDTHSENFAQLKNKLLPVTDQALSALLIDLQQRGLLDETLIVWMGEFGRSPKITHTQQFGPNGRDHWPRCYTVLLAGGGVRGGAIYGASDQHAAFPASDPVKPDDLSATMFWALGMDPAAEVHDGQGRPLRISKGAPLRSLF